VNTEQRVRDGKDGGRNLSADANSMWRCNNETSKTSDCCCRFETAMERSGLPSPSRDDESGAQVCDSAKWLRKIWESGMFQANKYSGSVMNKDGERYVKT